MISVPHQETARHQTYENRQNPCSAGRVGNAEEAYVGAPVYGSNPYPEYSQAASTARLPHDRVLRPNLAPRSTTRPQGGMASNAPVHLANVECKAAIMPAKRRNSNSNNTFESLMSTIAAAEAARDRAVAMQREQEQQQVLTQLREQQQRFWYQKQQEELYYQQQQQYAAAQSRQEATRQSSPLPPPEEGRESIGYATATNGDTVSSSALLRSASKSSLPRCMSTSSITSVKSFSDMQFIDPHMINPVAATLLDAPALV